MNFYVLIMLLACLGYGLTLVCMYLFQRNLIYFPTPFDSTFPAQQVNFDNQGVSLQGWVLNPGKSKAMIYFGGNSEMITANGELFDVVFSDYSVYLVNYRGYGNSQGVANQAALFSDALVIFDRLKLEHDAITAFGRSLGSGIAVYLASQRELDRLILLTPYDSIAAVAQKHYPLLPISWLIQDRYDSIRWGRDIQLKVLVVVAQLDTVLPSHHAETLVQNLGRAKVSYHMISGAAHNDIGEFEQYRQILREFITR